jgi:hypothetical protein
VSVAVALDHAFDFVEESDACVLGAEVGDVFDVRILDS